MWPQRRRGRGIGDPVRRILWLCIRFVCSSAVLVGVASGQTGTISGTVLDKDGKPISGASVMVLGKGLGAYVDAEGKYVIRSVPVGTYTVRANQVGYSRDEKEVPVDANRTTVADFRIAPTAYKLPLVIVTPQEKIRVRTQSSATINVVTLDDTRSLPLNDIMEHIALKAGVISQRGELHFRGGRGDEVLTIVNGIPSRNPMISEGVELGLLSISTSEQVLGGMDAQYGNALSGVISFTTREGSDKFGGEVRYFTDRYGEADKSFTDYGRMSLAFGGPFVFPSTNYFVSFQGTFTDTYLQNASRQNEHRFLDFIRIGNKQSNETNLSGKVTWKVSPNQKVNLELIRNASLNGRFHNRWNRNGFVQTFADSAAPTDGSVSQLYGTWAYYPVDSTFVPVNTADHLPITEENYDKIAVTFRSVLDSGTIYNVRASRQAWTTSQDVLDRQLWEYQAQPNQYYDPFNRVDGAYYVTHGDYPFYERRRSSTYTLNADLSKRIGRHNFMAGADINYNDLRYLLAQFPNVLGPDGNYGGSRDEFRNYNPEGSFFLQDRWQYEGMVMNAGIRYDNFAVGSQVDRNLVDDPVKTQWSPRIGFAYPISERDVMSFHYGRLFQVPDRLYIYQGKNLSAEARGNPNLDPETTVAYQLGIQHLFSREIYAQFGVYFKDIFGLLTTVQRQIPGLSETGETFVNGDYASSRGIEMTLIKEFSHGFAGEVNYTYSNSSGTASDPNRALDSSGNLRDQYKPTAEQPLNWDQRHSISATLRLGDDKNWGAAFVYQFGSGFPYTPEQRAQRRVDPMAENSRRLPSTSTLSVQANRMFRVWGKDLTFYLQGTNLLDAQNISALQPSLWPNNPAVNATSYRVYYTETGRAGGAFLGADRDGDAVDDWNPVNDPRVFQQGRVIRVGLGLQF